jgi:response regulator of citrate/malate metabolism
MALRQPERAARADTTTDTGRTETTTIDAASPDTNAADEPAPASLLALLDADYTRAILETIRDEARPARAIATACGASRSTVYRRLNRLADAGLVASRVAYDADGHHRTVYEATLESVAVDVAAGGVSVSVATTDSPDERRRDRADTI